MDSDDAKKWYHSFVPYERYIFEVGINVTILEKNFPVVLARMMELKLERFLESLRPANLRMVKELYANWNFAKSDTYVRGVWVNFHAEALCDFLGSRIIIQKLFRSSSVVQIIKLSVVLCVGWTR